MLNRGVQLGCRDDLVHESPAERRNGVDGLAREDHVGGGAGRDRSRQGLGPAGAGDVPKRDLRERKRGIVGGDADVAAEREFEPGPKAESVHASNGVATVAEQQTPHVPLVARAAGGHDGGSAAKLGNVRARAERPPLAPEHDDADVRVIAACLQVRPQQVAHLQVDGVQPVGPIERDRRHAASIDIEKDEVAHCRELLEEFADLEREPVQMREFDFVALGREP